MIRMLPYSVEQRLAHFVTGTIEHYRIGAMLNDQLADAGSVSRREDFIAKVAQRERQQLGNLRRIVDQQNAAQAFYFLAAGPVPGSRGFLPCAGSRSIIQIRPPAV